MSRPTYRERAQQERERHVQLVPVIDVLADVTLTFAQSLANFTERMWDVGVAAAVHNEESSA